MNKTRFEGLTKKQTEVLCQIALNINAAHHSATLESLVARGYLIKERGGFDGGYGVIYKMPIEVHKRWNYWYTEPVSE